MLDWQKVFLTNIHNCDPLRFTALSRLKGLVRLPKMGQADS